MYGRAEASERRRDTRVTVSDWPASRQHSGHLCRSSCLACRFSLKDGRWVFPRTGRHHIQQQMQQLLGSTHVSNIVPGPRAVRDCLRAVGPRNGKL